MRWAILGVSLQNVLSRYLSVTPSSLGAVHELSNNSFEIDSWGYQQVALTPNLARRNSWGSLFAVAVVHREEE